MDRNKNGTIKKGTVLNPAGRPKGSTNKSNTELREFLQLLIDENREQLEKDLQELEPKDRIKVILEMMRFVLPTLKNVESRTEFIEQPLFPDCN